MNVHFLSTLLLAGTLVSTTFAQNAAQPKVAQPATPRTSVSPLRSDREKVSYGFGLNVGRSMLRDGVQVEDIDVNLVIQGLRDALNDKPLPLSEEEFTAAFNKEIAPKLEERAKAALEKHRKDSQAFLAANKTRTGVKTTESGLQYKVLKPGTGKSPKATDTVRVVYRGTFVDGTVFDAVEKPIELRVDMVIKGWTEALQLMREGSEYELYVPASLAYGEQGYPPTIPPHSTLVFRVELQEVVPRAAEARE
jgi:FKBP-type peptidyl-prolyl cis-trans isomerase